jgi:hypothetical protein
VTPFGNDTPPNNWEEIQLADGEYTYGVGYPNSGYAFGSGSHMSAFLIWYFLDNWYTDEFYVSFYVRIPTWNTTNCKFFYPRFGASTQDKLEYGPSSANGMFRMHYNEGAALTWGYLSCPGLTDGGWRRHEWYVNFATGVARYWYEGTMLVDENHGSGWTTRYLYYLSFLHTLEAAPDGVTVTRFVDNIEVWDGMPSGGDTTPPQVSTASIGTDGVTVAIGFSETVVTTGYDNGDFDLDCAAAGNNIALNSISGSGSSRTFTAAATIYQGDTCNLDYTGGTNEIEDSAGNDLATFSNTPVTNNSTQTAPTLTIPGGVTNAGGAGVN